MNEKDKNFAILSKLYELADEIWENVEDKRAILGMRRITLSTKNAKKSRIRAKRATLTTK